MLPRLMLNPMSDTQFQRHVDSAVSDSEGDIQVAQRILRQWHPEAVIRARELSGETVLVWYVYRDGHWVR